MRAPRTCLDCGAVHTRARSRCGPCEQQFRSVYGGDWSELSRRLRAEHLAVHGPVCPGWHRDPHDVGPDDLTVDHVVAGTLEHGTQVLCRSCNSRKRNGGE